MDCTLFVRCCVLFCLYIDFSFMVIPLVQGQLPQFQLNNNNPVYLGSSIYGAASWWSGKKCGWVHTVVSFLGFHWQQWGMNSFTSQFTTLPTVLPTPPSSNYQSVVMSVSVRRRPLVSDGDGRCTCNSVFALKLKHRVMYHANLMDAHGCTNRKDSRHTGQ